MTGIQRRIAFAYQRGNGTAIYAAADRRTQFVFGCRSYLFFKLLWPPALSFTAVGNRRANKIARRAVRLDSTRVQALNYSNYLFLTDGSGLQSHRNTHTH